MGDPVPSAAIYDATTGGRSVIVITGGATGDVLTQQANGTYAAVTPAGGVSGTGSVDNAVLRADGTGGATLQNSSFVITDNATASPNNTVNHASLQVTGGTTNVSVSIVPKGTGAFTLSVPDGTTVGGNARGENAIDLQISRASASQVASGDQCVAIGTRNTASGATTIAIGRNNSATVYDSVAIGHINTGSFGGVAIGYWNISPNAGVAIGQENQSIANYAIAIGYQCVASGWGAFAWGQQALANQRGMLAHAVGRFAQSGDAQSFAIKSRNITTSAVATELFLNGSSERFAIASGNVMSALVRVVGVKSDGSEVIKFLRDVTIKNVGGTTSLESAVVTIGTDINASGATLDLSEDNTNDSLKIAITPPAGTWRWMATVEGINIAYGS